MALTPLLLQGWIPPVATFLNTPAWTMSAESFYYAIFPWLASWKKPWGMALRDAAGRGVDAGDDSRALYIAIIRTALRIRPMEWGPWLQVLKFTPLRTWPALFSASSWPAG